VNSGTVLLAGSLVRSQNSHLREEGRCRSGDTDIDCGEIGGLGELKRPPGGSASAGISAATSPVHLFGFRNFLLLFLAILLQPHSMEPAEFLVCGLLQVSSVLCWN
jgi:hypothetical protein